MNAKITPEYVLEMLQELKREFTAKKFKLKTFTKKYPSYNAFRKNLISKGIIKKQFGNYQWVSIEPNIVMAKELIKLYISESRQRQADFKYYTEQFKQKKLLESLEQTTIVKMKNPIMSLAKEIRETGETWNSAVSRASKIIKSKNEQKIQTRPQTTEELFPNSFIQDLKRDVKEKEQKINSLEIDAQKFKDEINGLKVACEMLQKKLSNESVLNDSLKQRLVEAEKGINENVRELSKQTMKLKEKLAQKEEEIFNLKQKNDIEIFEIESVISNLKRKHEEEISNLKTKHEEEISELQKQIVTKNTKYKSLKLFGIQIYNIEQR